MNRSALHDVSRRGRAADDVEDPNISGEDAARLGRHGHLQGFLRGRAGQAARHVAAEAGQAVPAADLVLADAAARAAEAGAAAGRAAAVAAADTRDVAVDEATLGAGAPPATALLALLAALAARRAVATLEEPVALAAGAAGASAIAPVDARLADAFLAARARQFAEALLAGFACTERFQQTAREARDRTDAPLALEYAATGGAALCRARAARTVACAAGPALATALEGLAARAARRVVAIAALAYAVHAAAVRAAHCLARHDTRLARRTARGAVTGLARLARRAARGQVAVALGRARRRSALHEAAATISRLEADGALGTRPDRRVVALGDLDQRFALASAPGDVHVLDAPRGHGAGGVRDLGHLERSRSFEELVGCPVVSLLMGTAVVPGRPGVN